MPSYVISGVSSGLGFEMVRQLSNHPENTLIGLVRNKAATDKKIAVELGDRRNIHILEISDITAIDDLKRAADETASITGGAIDYLIANAGYVTHFDSFDGLDTLAATKPKELQEDFTKSMDINVIGTIYYYNAFMPLVLKGQIKKVVAISSGMADAELCRSYDIETGAVYSCSKAALNIVTAKYSAQYKKDGILFLSICPGTADVGKYNLEQLTPHQLAGFGTLMAKFQQYQPNFKGPVTPDIAVKDTIRTWENASIDKGDGGAFLSHLGSKQWL
ncbi:NAD(P)-binding protein [Xylariaceae sp. AK1471]|nr:NAD(P)-binding protein [Xylariaceae sp. AK1471]